MKREAPHRKRLFIKVAAFWVLLSAGATHASAVTVDRIVAIVNNEVITLSELAEATAEAKISRQTKDPDVQGSSDSLTKTQHEILGKMIEKKLELQLARKKGISVSTEELNAALQDIKKRNNFPSDEALKAALAEEHLTFDQYKADLKDQLLILKLVNREVRSGILINEAELLDYYKQHPDAFAEPGSFKVSQIFFSLPPDAKPSKASGIETKARQVLELLQKDGNFKELARQYSESPEAVSGGSLGSFKAGHLLPEIDQAIAKLQVGQVSGLVRSSTGLHILRLDERKPARPKPFEEVQEAVREAVYQQRSDELYQRWIKDLWANAYVEIKQD